MRRYNSFNFEQSSKKVVSNLKRKVHERQKNAPQKTNFPLNRMLKLPNKSIATRSPCIDSAFISGGIGDVIAVESFLSNETRQNLKTIYYGTHKRQAIETLFNAIKTFPNLIQHINLWDDFSTFWCFHSLDECIAKCNSSQKQYDEECLKSRDLSIGKVFAEIKKGNMKYNGSSFLRNKLTDISHFNLQTPYVTVLPYSTDKRIAKRDFCSQDWEQLLNILKKNQIKGIIINSENEDIPNSEWLINLSQKTSLLEAIELLKKSKGYFGIDSWMSVLAAKLFDYPNLQVKTNNQHCIDNAYFYFAPKKTFGFMVQNIKEYNQTIRR